MDGARDEDVATRRRHPDRGRRGTFAILSVAVATLTVLTALAVVPTLGSDPRRFVFTRATTSRAPMRLDVFGDSLAAGMCAPHGAGFVDLIAERLATARPGSRLANYAIAGAHARDLPGQIARSSPGADAVMIVVGANDLEHATPPAAFLGAFRRDLALVHAKDPHATVLVLGIPDISVRRHWNYGAFLFSPWTRWYDDLERRTAVAHDASFASLYALSHEQVATDPRDVCGDGIHPNATGYAIFARLLWPTVERAFAPVTAGG